MTYIATFHMAIMSDPSRMTRATTDLTAMDPGKWAQ